MKDYEQSLTSLLSYAIRGQNPGSENYSNTDWKSVYEEAKAHQVHLLIYPLLKHLKVGSSIDNNLLLRWKNEIILESLWQVQNIERMKNVLNAFNQAGIPVIAMKGLVLRDLYPYPDFRILTDSDILVQKEDIEQSKQLLQEMNYHMTDSSSKRIHFDHDIYMPIELHSSIVDVECIRNAKWFGTSIWENALPYKIGDIPVLALSEEDQILHLCLHMSCHFRGSGFGLKQLCDLALYIESKKDAVDWNDFCNMVKTFEIFRFTTIVFLVCKRLFGVEIPQALYCHELENDSRVSMFIEYIYSSGVFGMRDMDKKITSMQWDLINHENYSHMPGKLISSVPLAFPSAKNLKVTYSFAKKYPFLIPFAWIYRFIRGVFRKDYTLSQKIAFVFPSKTSLTLLNKYNKLLQFLEL